MAGGSRSQMRSPIIRRAKASAAADGPSSSPRRTASPPAVSSGHHGSHDMGASYVPTARTSAGCRSAAARATSPPKLWPKTIGRPAVDDGDQVLHLLVDAERWPDPDGAPVAAAVVDHDPEVIRQAHGRPSASRWSGPSSRGRARRGARRPVPARAPPAPAARPSPWSPLAHRVPLSLPLRPLGLARRSLTVFRSRPLGPFARRARSSSSALGRVGPFARCARSPTPTMAWPRSSSSGP